MACGVFGALLFALRFGWLPMRAMRAAALIGVGCVLLALAGCSGSTSGSTNTGDNGGGGGTTGTPTGSYTITVTASGGGYSDAAGFMLNVQ